IIVAAQGPIEKVTKSASKISADAEAIIARVRAGEGSIGKLLNDDAVYNSIAGSTDAVEEMMRSLNKTSADVQALVARFKSGEIPADIERTLKNVSEASERLKVMIASFQPAPGGGEGVAGDLRATLGSARQAMFSLDENLEALKHSFFFRGFFKDRGFYDLGSLSTVEYQSKEFEKSVTKERAWVPQDELFTLKENGAEELSDAGRKKLDATMAKFLQFTKDRAVIVE